jgi:CHAT domain-containing protein/tetratricopeptide (TPR) repeat protein
MFGRRGALPKLRLQWLWVAASCVAAILFLLRPPQEHVERSAAAEWLLSQRDARIRTIEPRLSGGFAWAPLRNETSRERLLASVLDAKRAALRGEPVFEDRHAGGVALLLSGHIRQALAELSEIAASANDASAWNDLAAAYHEAALRYDAPELFSDALASCDRALAHNAQFPEALFNRALMIERLGLRTDARKAWVRYLETDADSGWADEARAHLQQPLHVEKPFLASLHNQYEAVANSAEAAERMYLRDPFGARGLVLKEVLAQWGEAFLNGDAAAAERHLRVARNFGTVVARHGDRTLAGCVAAIDAANPQDRAILAASHRDFRDAVNAFFNQMPTECERLHRRAAAGFARANSPAVLPASFFAANAVYEQGRHDEAERQIRRLFASVPAESPAYRAFMLWQLGICHRSRADWGAAIDSFEQSAALFERLGETQNSTTVRRLLAFVYDRIGDTEEAWRNRMAGIGTARSSSSAMVHEKTASSIAEAALLRGQWHKAESFLTLHEIISRRMDDKVLVVDALLLRAVVRDRLGDHAAVNADLAAAKLVTQAIEDPTYRASARVAHLRATAMLSTTPPATAEALITEAIALRAMQSDPASLPMLLLQRARARKASGNTAGAMEDVKHGVAELEARRESLPEGDVRWGAFHGAEELFEEGVELALAKNDADGALRFAERARARALLDAYGRSPEIAYAEVPPKTVIVEYVALPSRLVVFTIDSTGVQAQSIAYAREALANDVKELRRSLTESTSIGANARAAAMYQRLIAPIASRLEGAARVVFVPGSVAAGVPFGALVDREGAPLLDRFPIVNAGSAAAFVAASARRAAGHRPRNAVLITASQGTGGLNTLRFTLTETQRIEELYPQTTRIDAHEAQFAELVRHAPAADVIHFAGHAIGDDSGFEPASIVLSQDGRMLPVGVSEISRLRLLNAPVVVLAGCSTARGRQRATEGVISVAHGFLSAGAPSVIATLWPIDDGAASIFFPRLHRYLATGMPPAEALRAAQLESIRRGDVPASLWAAIQIIGS